jgi:predicted metal-dependent phosphotriesterase family hydrolase
MDGSSSEAVFTPDKLMQVYSKMRDKLEALQRDVDKVEDDMKTVKIALLDHFKVNGADSIRTSHGLAYRSVKVTHSTADWESFHRFILDHEVPQLLEKRINQKNMKDFLEQNPETIPPGLNTVSEYTITIRRK